MAKTLFFLSEIKSTEAEKNNGVFPLEIWILLFQNLRPVFLNSVLRTCKLFNALAGSNSFFNLLLARDFPTTPQVQLTSRTQPPPEDAAYVKYQYLRSCRFHSSRANNLYELCLDLAFTQIKKFNFDFNDEPDLIFNVDRVSNRRLLEHINCMGNQLLLDILFERVHAWFVAKAKADVVSNNYLLSFFADYYDDRMRFQSRTTCNHSLMELAVTLNQVDFVKQNRLHLKYSKEEVGLAFHYGHLELVKELLMTVNLVELYDPLHHPLHDAIHENQVDVVEFVLLTQPIDDSILVFSANSAISDQCLDALKILLSHKPDINKFRYMHNGTLLHLACNRAQPKAGMLIANTYPELLDVDFHGYIEIAAAAGCRDLIQFFLEKVEDIPRYLRDHPGLHIRAAHAERPMAVEYLLDMGIDVDETYDGVTALYTAAMLGRLSVVQALVERDAKLTFVNEDGQTALDAARVHRHEPVIRYLTEVQYQQGKKRRADMPPAVDDKGDKEPDLKRQKR